MNRKRTQVMLFFIAAGIFISLGMFAAPRNPTYLVLGIVFGILGVAALRRSRLT